MFDLVKHFFIAMKYIARGGRNYYLWVGSLGFLVAVGAATYLGQLDRGLIITAMRDQVSWGFYISNFTFLVGVAAAAVLLVIPAYLYHFKPIKEIVLFGELLAITAISMCILFIIVDMGQPLRVWHLLPFIGSMNFPASLLAWDVIVLNGYLIINTAIAFYVLYRLSIGKDYKMSIIGPLIILSIPWAVSIHTVTAFLYNGLSSRPFWNASILAPRFLASAFCSGPAIMLLLFQIIRKLSKVEIDNKAIFKISELIAYAMGLNLFLLGAEAFKEFYSGSIHSAPMEYLYLGLHGHNNLVPWMWFATTLNIIAFFLFLFPKTRENFTTLNMGCLFIISGVYIEKGMGLVIPGFVPDTLGEIYEYTPSMQEILITIGIWAFGALLYTVLIKFAIPVYTGELRFFSRAQLLTAGGVMNRRIFTVLPETPLEEVRKLLLQKEISTVPVVDSGNRLLGIVTESDAISQEIEQISGRPSEKTAADVLSEPPVVVGMDEKIQDVGQQIASAKAGSIIVTDEEKRPVGTLTSAAVLKALENIRRE